MARTLVAALRFCWIYPRQIHYMRCVLDSQAVWDLQVDIAWWIARGRPSKWVR